MAKVITKNELMITYKAIYGEKALDNALYMGYTKKDFETAIDTYKSLENSWGDEKFESLKKGRTLVEREKLKTLKNFI